MQTWESSEMKENGGLRTVRARHTRAQGEHVRTGFFWLLLWAWGVHGHRVARIRESIVGSLSL
jgi:hypothetical protein